ncbi:Lin0512 family protein [Gammaproteobacteria bacterium]|nr:Lin0512 family protein [Gammaproteobacteria bacterium]
MKTRYVTEMGMGTDVHGRDYTQAAERAVFDAIHHSSLHFFASLGKTADDMFIDLLIGVPEPDKVDTERVAAALPYGTVSIKVQKGGLEIPADDSNDAIVIANAGVVVRLAD